MESDIAQHPVIFDQNVACGDMDANGHVNNFEYLRYMENARFCWFNLVDQTREFSNL